MAASKIAAPKAADGSVGSGAGNLLRREPASDLEAGRLQGSFLVKAPVCIDIVGSFTA